MTWDITVQDTYTESDISNMACTAGTAAQREVQIKSESIPHCAQYTSSTDLQWRLETLGYQVHSEDQQVHQHCH